MGKLALKSRHRLICGDSTDANVVATLMGFETARLCFTSPPYGNQRDYKTGGISDWDALMQGVFAQLPMSPDAQVLVNLGLIHRDNEWVPYWDGWLSWMRTQGWRRFAWYVWDQGFALMGDWNGRLAPSFEFIFHFNKESRKPNKIIEKKPENIVDRTGDADLRAKDGEINKRTSGKASLQTHKIPDSIIRVTRQCGSIGDGIGHPAVFPVALPEFVIQAYTDQDDMVYEPFGGSGTTMLACEKTGRRCRIIELAPEYCDVIIKRYEQFTGERAVRWEG